MSSYRNWVNAEILSLVEVPADAKAYLDMARADLYDGPDGAYAVASEHDLDYPGFADAIALALDEIDFDDIEIDGTTYDRRYVRRLVLGSLAEYV